MYNTLDALRVTQTLAEWRRSATEVNKLDEAVEHEQVWSALIELLEELDGAMGDESMTARQFREVVESGLADFSLGLVPPTLDQLVVGSIERSRHPAIKAAFVLGFCEGGFPARIGEETIFGDAERAFLAEKNVALGRSRDDQQLDERALAYIALTRASEFLWLSYPTVDASGRKIEPSAFLPAILAAAPDVRIETVRPDEPSSISSSAQLAARIAQSLREWATADRTDVDAGPWLAMYEWARRTPNAAVRNTASAALQSLAPTVKAELSQRASSQLWPPPFHTSITQLESLAECPFKHFSGYGLRLTERAEGEVSRVHLGNLYHEMLEQFVNQLIETGETFSEMSDAKIASRVGALCDQLMPLYAERLGLSDAEVRKTIWRASAKFRLHFVPSRRGSARPRSARG
ncbi:MAG: PD-(D/E)XK nuclease family protein [Planctomycetes bacterium]|nr:PD-(D/E)XK nuclease family protein [Planctomycetota bacterium]